MPVEAFGDQSSYVYMAVVHSVVTCFNWDSLHASLNSHYEAWNYKKKKHTGNLFTKNLQLKGVC